MHEMKNDDYQLLVGKIKQEIDQGQARVAMAVNSSLLYMYWQIGGYILAEQNKQGWGAKVIDRLAQDLKHAYPKLKGFSSRNLKYMRKFAQEWPLTFFMQQPAAQIEPTENAIVQQPAAQFKLLEKNCVFRVPWSHHLVLLDKFDTTKDRYFYAEQIVVNAWSRNVLLNKIDQKLHLAVGGLPNNFKNTLPQHQANLVEQTFKDPYFFDFLQLGDEASEREIENKLTSQISDFLLELGAGFSYLGRQYKLEVGSKEYFLDLLFYHTKLRCYVNIELKIDEFKPEYLGKSQFYLTAINNLVKDERDNPSIGIILCKEANRIVVEFALQDNNAPIGVAEYKLVHKLPAEMENKLFTAEQLEQSIKLKNKE